MKILRKEEIIIMTRKEAGKLIHGFTAAHGGTAFLLPQIPFADTAALTAEMLTMVTLIAKKCGID